MDINSVFNSRPVKLYLITTDLYLPLTPFFYDELPAVSKSDMYH